ncbi:STAS domain-containing protein [Streptomyces bullii]|uniref:Anti-sigma factor antagonist n=1 Tax=Streptomyces bullii TaxID=349910 RepID=A0ABW0UWE1_9ACTN
MAGTDELAGPDRLSITSALIDGTTVVIVKGEVDHHTTAPLRQALTPPDGLTRPRTVADLSGVTFMDSSGINALIAAHQAHGDQGWLRLAGIQPSVQRVLQLVGVDTLIACYPTLDNALEA